MFGCTTLITNYRTSNKKGGTKKDDDLVSIYHAEDIRLSHGIVREGFVVFAMLGGGDYNTGGLRDCGGKLASIAANQKTGLDVSLCSASERELPLWRDRLVEFLRAQRKSISVPMDFPQFKTLKKYNHPLVSSMEELATKGYPGKFPFMNRRYVA